jgi:signal transduction histidine kinase
MGAAMRNERFAVRQKLADVYRVQLSVSQGRLQQYWTETAAKLEKLAATTPAPAAFANCVGARIAESVIIFDGQGRVVYPNAPSAVGSKFGDLDPKWQEAGQLEHLRQYTEAAQRYEALAREMTNENFAARAFQAQARCLARAGQNDAVIRLVSEVFGSERFRYATDPQGRLIAANSELMVLELITNRNSQVFHSAALRLAARLMDYESPVMAAPQRRFLMKELQRLSPEKFEFPTLRAEELAAELVENHPNGRPSPSIPVFAQGKGQFNLCRAVLPELWQFTTPDRRVLGLFRSDKLLAAAQAAMADNSLVNAEVTLTPPDVDTPNAFVTQPAGEQMPGWRLALSLKDPKALDVTARGRTAIYLWSGILVLAVMGALTFITLRLLRRQMTLARLKNDLAATVSHELKTPLSSMRVLVETLLDAEEFDQQKTREYLQLIAGENERLGRLIQNFLTFSRMERRKYNFHFSTVPARQMVDAAIASVRARLDASGRRLELEIEDNLPPVMADPDAFAAVLINLLENAYKYSEENGHVVLSARAMNSSVIFSVKDNGIGIAPWEQKKIFHPFYQVDQHLSRKSRGCGLGLSIVRFITAAHGGNVSVRSGPGGSTFTISLPVASVTMAVRKEAIV